MKNISDVPAKQHVGRLHALVLFLLLSTFTPLYTLKAQSQIIWQSVGSGFGNSKFADYSITSLLGQSFVGEASGGGIFLRSGFVGLGSTMTSVKASQEKFPTVYTLYQNYPNPFNPTTVIAFGIPEASHVSLQIFDIVGREVTTLVNEDLMPGNYRSTFIAERVSSGVFFYRIVAARKSDNRRLFVETKKLMLIK